MKKLILLSTMFLFVLSSNSFAIEKLQGHEGIKEIGDKVNEIINHLNIKDVCTEKEYYSLLKLKELYDLRLQLSTGSELENYQKIHYKIEERIVECQTKGIQQ